MIYTALTKLAISLSFSVHCNQIDKGGMPYVYHPYHIAEQMDDEYSICVAMLHDVVEDTHLSDNPITFSDLEKLGFPDEVIASLRLMTRDSNTDYMDYIRRIRTDAIARKVKIADLKHNSDLTRLETVDGRSVSRLKKYSEALRILEDD